MMSVPKNPINLTPFVGRSSELEKLLSLTKKKVASLVVVHGRRRVGKSRLIEEFGKKLGKNARFYAFSGLPPRPTITTQDQLDEFARQLSYQTGLPEIKADDWSKLFILLAEKCQKGRVTILLDEITWMGSKDPDFLGKIKNAWDMYFKKNPTLILILCGSVSSWIEENILQSTGFVGRVSLTLTLQEFSLRECNNFFEEIDFHSSAYDKFKILSVTGGIPKYLEEIRPDISADENIKLLCFEKSGILFKEFDHLFSDLFSKKYDFYKKIVKFLVSQNAEFNDISHEMNISKGGYLSESLDVLIKSGFIKRDYTWNLRTKKEARLSHYRLSDNYLRFYLKYIDKNKWKIENDQFNDRSIVGLPGWESIIGLQFENLVLNNRKLIWEKLHIYAEDIVADNPFFQRKTVRTPGCQIDYLIQTSANALYVCEIKFSKNALSGTVIEQMKEKLSRLSVPKGLSHVPILIHVNGVQDIVEESEYFKNIVDFSEFFDAGS